MISTTSRDGTLHKPALSQLCMEGMQSHGRLLPRGGIELHLDFRYLQRQSLDCHQHIQTCCDGAHSSGSHCTPVSRRRGRWSLQVSSTLFPWWKRSTRHMHTYIYYRESLAVQLQQHLNVSRTVVGPLVAHSRYVVQIHI